MSRDIVLKCEFPEFIPERLEPETLYISRRFEIAIHLCACGCGINAVTPLGRDGWTLTFDNETVSLAPSIGNQGFPCKSHYWIRNGRIVWA